MKPCRSCPFRPKAQRGLWVPAHYLLIAYLGSVEDFVAPGAHPSMGCHKSNEVMSGLFRTPPKSKWCGGWIRAARNSMAARIAAFDMPAAEREEMQDRVAVLTPSEMARVNGLDMDRLPPLAWPYGSSRYPTFDSWRDEILELRRRLVADPDYAQTFVVPGSPLDVGATPDQVRDALGVRAARRYAEAAHPAVRTRPRG